MANACHILRNTEEYFSDNSALSISGKGWLIFKTTWQKNRTLSIFIFVCCYSLAERQASTTKNLSAWNLLTILAMEISRTASHSILSLLWFNRPWGSLTQQLTHRIWPTVWVNTFVRIFLTFSNLLKAWLKLTKTFTLIGKKSRMWRPTSSNDD